MREEPIRRYDRTWSQIEEMLDKAELKQNWHYNKLLENNQGRETRLHHMRNYKALEGVVKTLKWVLGEKDVNHPLE